ncbi:MAG: hypothetical protein K6F51_05920 [Acetatifactor sp.]|nr:hypothetical protein [Acetatifactor sp.]
MVDSIDALSNVSETRYIVDKDVKILKLNEHYHLRTARGVMILNEKQYDILCHFMEGESVENVLHAYHDLDENKVMALIDKFIFEKIINREGAAFYQKKTVGYYFRKLTRFNLPSKPFVAIVMKFLVKLNMKLVLICSALMSLAGIMADVSLVRYTQFTWRGVPRLTVFIIVGMIVALYHELWMATYVARGGGEKSLSFKLRFLLGVFISVVVNWQYLLQYDVKKRIGIFLKVDLITAGFCGLLSVPGLVAMQFGAVEVAYFFCCCSIIGYSYVLLNLYPFFFKNDGYNIFCFLTGTKRLRSYWFRFFYSLVCKERINYVDKGKMKYYVLWGTMFVLTFIFIVYAIKNNIRIRI